MKNITNYLALGAVALGLTGVAQAVPTLRLTSGANTITITDGGAGDSNGQVGAVTWIGSLGSWTLNVSTGITKPILGSSGNPHMDLNSVNTSNSAVATSLTIEFSDTGFTAIGSGSTNIGGTTLGNVTYQTYWSASNAALAKDNLMTSQAFGGPAFSGSATGSGPNVNLYSLTQVVTISHGAGSGQNSSFDAEVRVPDSGSTIALLGAALATLGLISRRRKVA